MGWRKVVCLFFKTSHIRAFYMLMRPGEIDDARNTGDNQNS